MIDKPTNEVIVRRSVDAKCIGCGYALRGLIEARCPECGRKFNRDDAATFNSGRHHGRLAGWLLQPTRWLAPLSVPVFICVIAVQMIFFLPVAITLTILIFVWLVLAGPYLFWSIARRAVCVAYAQPQEYLRPDRNARRAVSRNFLIAAIVVFSTVPHAGPFLD